MKRKGVSFILFSLLFVAFLNAQNQESKKSIFESLSTVDANNTGTVKIHQDRRVEQLLSNKKFANNSQDQATTNGYRVQIYSSNVQRTAKNDAFKIEKQIREVYPNQTVYVNYTSPFWKVRVGDFVSKTEAQSFRTKLIYSFPTLKSEIYIVREQILISASK